MAGGGEGIARGPAFREGEAQRIRERLVELRGLEAGWLGEGAGAVVHPALFEPVLRVALAYQQAADDEADFPRIFPTPEGGLQVEILGAEIRAEVFEAPAGEVAPQRRGNRPRRKAGEAQRTEEELLAAGEIPAATATSKVVFQGFCLTLSETIASDDEAAVAAYLVRADLAQRADAAAKKARTDAAVKAEAERVAALEASKAERAEADTVVPAPVPPVEPGHTAPPTLRREER